MFVIGTAGHVDHGKSALIERLTGVHPDRLQQEQERGLTIELGFGWLELPSGTEISLIDVPGHIRFVRHMLAGIGGIDAVLLIIAADEGIMPQTLEHLSILRLMNIDKGLVVLTKSDLVDSDWLDLITDEIRGVLSKTGLNTAPILTTSAATGDGFDELLTEIDRLCKNLPSPRNIDRPRLSVDRCFTMSGFGTVVTGTLLDGPIAVGDMLELSPIGQTVRVRGVQTHGSDLDKALPGSRVAVNLTGVSVDDVSRGMVLSRPGTVQKTSSFDATINLLGKAPLKHNQKVHVHCGAAEIQGRVRLVGTDTTENHEPEFVQILLSEPLATAEGELYIIRVSDQTIGGGKILSINPARHRRSDKSIIEPLSALSSGSFESKLLTTIRQIQPTPLSGIVELLTESSTKIDSTLGNLIESKSVLELKTSDANAVYITSDWLESTKEYIGRLIDQHLEVWPLRAGIPREELRANLSLDAGIYSLILQLLEEYDIKANSDVVTRSSWVPQLSDSQKTAVADFVDSLKSAGYAPNRTDIDPELTQYLERERIVKNLGDGVIFEIGNYESARDTVLELLEKSNDSSLGVIRDALSTNRRITQALLETMDKEGLTARIGDGRKITERGRTLRGI